MATGRSRRLRLRDGSRPAARRVHQLVAAPPTPGNRATWPPSTNSPTSGSPSRRHQSSARAAPGGTATLDARATAVTGRSGPGPRPWAAWMVMPTRSPTIRHAPTSSSCWSTSRDERNRRQSKTLARASTAVSVAEPPAPRRPRSGPPPAAPAPTVVDLRRGRATGLRSQRRRRDRARRAGRPAAGARVRRGQPPLEAIAHRRPGRADLRRRRRPGRPTGWPPPRAPRRTTGARRRARPPRTAGRPHRPRGRGCRAPRRTARHRVLLAGRVVANTSTRPTVTIHAQVRVVQRRRDVAADPDVGYRRREVAHCGMSPTRRAYAPPRASSASWVPRSTTRPRSSTTISSQSRIVDSRCATMRQVQPRRRRWRRPGLRSPSPGHWSPRPAPGVAGCRRAPGRSRSAAADRRRGSGRPRGCGPSSRRGRRSSRRGCRRPGRRASRRTRGRSGPRG